MERERARFLKRSCFRRKRIGSGQTIGWTKKGYYLLEDTDPMEDLVQNKNAQTSYSSDRCWRFSSMRCCENPTDTGDPAADSHCLPALTLVVTT